MDEIDPMPEPTETPHACAGYIAEALPTSESRAACIASWRKRERCDVTGFEAEFGREAVAAYVQGSEAREDTVEIGAGREVLRRRSHELANVAPSGEMAPKEVTTTRRLGSIFVFCVNRGVCGV